MVGAGPPNSRYNLTGPSPFSLKAARDGTIIFCVGRALTLPLLTEEKTRGPKDGSR